MAHVLLIDDDPQVLFLLRWVLEESGHQVAEAPNGRAGVQAYTRGATDVVICDQFMPVLDGLETIRQLRALDPAAVVVAMTGESLRGGSAFPAAARAAGAAAVLSKPFEPAALLSLVGELLASPAGR
ncbi:response regulator [Gemmata sp. JC717]|uniref:Response regulator n=1 Tax=Gemmata algarum TaxID=2975278 RepID=A0ABU5F037_9BACT|nr:response regulator [Gemmata algarum]MDY3552047.1 response regulator [Gemmata algarum]MDY3560117.1 response regulator [Gemmata algarum]